MLLIGLRKSGGNMNKKLSDMTLEELWQLFPIFLTEHQDCWAEWFKEESVLLLDLLSGQPIIRISHMGSTSVMGIWAKPIIDILIELEPKADMQSVGDVLTESGYLCMSQNKCRLSFNKGYTEDGFAERVFHLHVRYAGDNDELYFRDYLNENLLTAKEYEKLKLSLWKVYKHDRDGYTNAKADFIFGITETAKKKYGGRYSWVEDGKYNSGNCGKR